MNFYVKKYSMTKVFSILIIYSTLCSEIPDTIHMSIDSETRSILDKPVPRTILTSQFLLTAGLVATAPAFLQATILLLTFLMMVKPAAPPC